MKVTIDRFEGDFAVVELPDGSYADLPKIFVPEAAEGDFVNIEAEKGTDRAERNRNRLRGLFL